MKMNQKGFTLVELLVVIAIIGVIAGLVMTGVSFTRRKATSTQCKSYLKQIATASLVYSQDAGAFPDVADMSELATALVPTYTDNAEIFSCADRTAGTATYDYNQGLFNTSVLRSSDNIRGSISALVFDNEDRHTSQRNVCFADGHVESVSDGGTWNTKLADWNNESIAGF